MAHALNNRHQVVLIVSTGRTGTKALAQHLNACYEDQVLALHEPPPTRFTLRRAANRFLCGRMSREELVKVLTGQRERIFAGLERPVYVESNPGLAGFLDAFAEVFEDFRVLHVVRDPRSYVASALDWGVFRGAKGLLANYLPYWLPKPEYIDPSGGLAWRRMTGVERLAWYWQLINRHLDRGAELFPDRYRRVRFEDLFARDGHGLAEFVEWVGLPPNDRLAASANGENVNASRSRAGSRWPEWAERDKRALLRFCAPAMARYGYDLSADADLLEPSGRPAVVTLT